MAEVYFDPAVGGDGSTVSDDSDPTTGLDGGGHVTRFVPALAQVVAVADNTVAKATEAAASAASALNAPGTNATSTTSLTIGTGTKTLTIQTGKAYVAGQTLVIASTASPSNQMTGIVDSYTSGSGSLVVVVPSGATSGSGTFSAWTVSMGVIVNSTLPSQTGNANKFLMTDGTSPSWVSVLKASNNLSDLGSASTARTNLGLGSLATASTINDANWSGTDLAVANGGTGSSTAAGARTNLSAAASGANGDITSLSALSTPLSIAQGGTGASTASAARTALGLGSIATQASSAVAITGGTVTNITDLAVADGGTGSSTAAGARSNLGAAAAGANTDITSLSLTTPLAVASGGTGGDTAAEARTGILPSVTGKPGGVLQVNSGGTDWEAGWRAMVTFSVSGGTPTIQASRNVTSVTRTDTGDYTITFANAAPDEHYAGGGMANRVGSGDSLITSSNRTSTWTSGAAYITFSDQGGSPYDPGIARLRFGY